MTCETGLGEWIDFRRLKWRVGKGIGLPLILSPLPVKWGPPLGQD